MPVSTYDQLLRQAQQSYQTIMNGYTNVLQGPAGQEHTGIAGGYGRLSRDVLTGIAGIERSQRQAIRDTYADQSGRSTQSLISRGLGNTTVQNSIQRGLTLDKTKADIALSNQTAALRAGYQSQLGLAGLGFRGNSLHQNRQQNYAGAVPSHFGVGGGGGGGVSMNDPVANANQRDRQDRMRDQNDPMVRNPYAGGGFGAGGSYGGGLQAYGGAGSNPWQYAPPEEFVNPVPGYTYDWGGSAGGGNGWEYAAPEEQYAPVVGYTYNWGE